MTIITPSLSPLFSIFLFFFPNNFAGNSLVATIKESRSDLLQDVIVKEGTEPIVQTPSPNIQAKYNYGMIPPSPSLAISLSPFPIPSLPPVFLHIPEIPDLGIPMLAMYSPQSRLFDPTGW
jgi:hypothetical protein